MPSAHIKAEINLLKQILHNIDFGDIPTVNGAVLGFDSINIDGPRCHQYVEVVSA
jgi:hypothetical protein